VGVFVSVRGWVECWGEQFAQVRDIARAEADSTYGGGWAFPERRYNWADFAFYGASIRESGLDAFLRQVRMIAAVPADEDGARVVGLFLVSHEVDGMSEWQVREGAVHIRGVEAYRYLDE
jgi:hypothetical protein